MNTRELLLKTAIRLFSERGFDRTSTSLISKTAELGTGTLFKHFSSKEDLIDEAYIHCKGLFAEGIRPQINMDGSCRESLESLWTSGIAWVFENSLEYSFLMQFESSTVASRLAQDKVHEKLKFINEILEKGIQNGRIVDLPVHFLLALLGAQFKAAFLYMNDNPEEPREQWIKTTFELAWKGIKT
ncbi:MAG: TetR/AcrR family transcriptional regulator [Pseudobacteriovorax sp.]|nr:TetR/AcrR family transcriptional regulator [Pseudobacteriovorax sp.]